ncbi:Dyp-type peroxidase [Granulosicoccus antarcticus]|uniref:Multifunctional dye peroxidase DyP2 n=1 Tax=Granulosicoccus antarcticus IMCC3135 TaxID=1192854 RepID=A0A2Z2NZ98_9GAMM|nr:hypothetical protein [Granulosicoccus antarcticus]ASJ76613.1 Multifunctional dye peroxidase DyP2 [Granulosicoccus antarcticus IMCC3135]
MTSSVMERQAKVAGKTLNLSDIQGNVVRAYGHIGYFHARYLFFRINDPGNARAFLTRVAERVTNSAYADSKRNTRQTTSKASTNVAFTFAGLQAIELPAGSLMGFPQEFAAGMKKRMSILGDEGSSAPEHWDNIWQKEVHLWVSINGLSNADVEERYQWILRQNKDSGDGVELLSGHRGAAGEEDLMFQTGAILRDENGNPSGKEHFGYRDGISDPVFEGQPNAPDTVLGRGKLLAGDKWAPLAPGEFLLGHLDEAQEYPKAPMPRSLAQNGTFMVYRKLHQNVATFRRYLDDSAAQFEGSKEMLAAKFCGRWRDNGAPIVDAPDDAGKKCWDARFEAADAAEKRRMLTDFHYNDDIDGARCPMSGHLRRMNPRGSLEFGQKGAFNTPSALADRRRILRRGLPYGQSGPDTNDADDHGIIFMALNASIERQFEFVQQQWVNYGNDFKEGNDKEILLGNHTGEGKAVLQVEPGSGKPPHFLTKLPRFVECRGGDYFFVPGITALKMIAAGIVDPT